MTWLRDAVFLLFRAMTRIAVPSLPNDGSWCVSTCIGLYAGVTGRDAGDIQISSLKMLTFNSPRAKISSRLLLYKCGCRGASIGVDVNRT
jgi:hypothetical protein